jgi:hypothetical protein
MPQWILAGWSGEIAVVQSLPNGKKIKRQLKSAATWRQLTAVQGY